MDECTSLSRRYQSQKIVSNIGRRSYILYESLTSINIDWQGLQNLFSQQYSKIGNTREQLFHAWWSFHFDGNAETIDTYTTHIRQVATLLDHRGPQILEVFKSILPTKLYWVLFPIDDLGKQ